ncbi:MAG: DUF3622 domain-containing protein [Gammaproteobacteria bacterium]|nr:DUF3622 domain-containing protein [Gammaproteobacteria bacterium]
MSKGNKYDFRVVQEKSGWSAEIVRRVSARKSIVSKRQDGFASETEAQQWGENELKSFVELQEQRNQREALLRNNNS